MAGRTSNAVLWAHVARSEIGSGARTDSKAGYRPNRSLHIIRINKKIIYHAIPVGLVVGWGVIHSGTVHVDGRQGYPLALCNAAAAAAAASLPAFTLAINMILLEYEH